MTRYTPTPAPVAGHVPNPSRTERSTWCAGSAILDGDQPVVRNRVGGAPLVAFETAGPSRLATASDHPAPAGSVPTTAALYPPARPRRRRRLATLRLVREGSFAAPDGHPDADVPIRSPRDVFALMAPYADREVAESFWILPLDAQHRLARGGPTVITRGILNSSLVHPREVFLAAIVAGAAALVLVHNHPSGDPTPSPDDRAITEQLTAAGRLLDIPVHDHVIVGRGRYLSFAEAGLL